MPAKPLDTIAEWYLPTYLPDSQTRWLVVRSPCVCVCVCVLIPLCTQTPGWSCTFEITLTECVLTFKKFYQEQQKEWRLLSSVAVTLSAFSICVSGARERKGWILWCLIENPSQEGDINLGISPLSCYLYWNSFEGVHISEASTVLWNWFENDQLIQKQQGGWRDRHFLRDFQIVVCISEGIGVGELIPLTCTAQNKTCMQRLLSEPGNFLLQIYWYWTVHLEQRYWGLL